MIVKARIIYKGGKGSGNFGHSGRPGKVGGSGGGGKVGGSGGGSVSIDRDTYDYAKGYIDRRGFEDAEDIAAFMGIDPRSDPRFASIQAALDDEMTRRTNMTAAADAEIEFKI